MPEKIYSARKVCRNCGKREVIEIEFGIPMNIAEQKQKCDYCGCDCIIQRLEG